VALDVVAADAWRKQLEHLRALADFVGPRVEDVIARVVVNVHEALDEVVKLHDGNGNVALPSPLFRGDFARGFFGQCSRPGGNFQGFEGFFDLRADDGLAFELGDVVEIGRSLAVGGAWR
jgi:hypothetical protein